MKTGSIILASTLVATCILLYAGFKTYSSGKIALKDVSEGKATTLEDAFAHVGDEGITTSYLRPNGKAMINGNKLEVYSLGEYIEGNKKVKVVKIAENKIFVKQINEA
jgi:membrane-bound ClpP family serine protease